MTNPARAGFTVKLCTASLAPLDTQSSSAPELELRRRAGAETIFLVLTRADVNDVDFSVTWQSALSYLTLETISLEVNEETGPDWWGADELELSVTIDGEAVYSNTWDDADSDEDWPNLAADIRSAVRAKVGTAVDWVPFADAIVFSLIKTDGIFAHGSSVGTLSSLKPGDGDVLAAAGTIVISDPAGDGEAIIGGELRRFRLY